MLKGVTLTSVVKLGNQVTQLNLEVHSDQLLKELDAQDVEKVHPEVINKNYQQYLRAVESSHNSVLAKQYRAELAARAGVSPAEFVSPWQQVASLQGDKGCKSFHMLVEQFGDKHAVFEQHDGTCIIVTIISNADGIKTAQAPKLCRASLDRVLKKFNEKHDLVSNLLALKEAV